MCFTLRYSINICLNLLSFYVLIYYVCIVLFIYLNTFHNKYINNGKLHMHTNVIQTYAYMSVCTYMGGSSIIQFAKGPVNSYKGISFQINLLDVVKLILILYYQY